MLKVKLIEYDDLTEEEQDDQPDNGCGKEDASYIRVLHNDETVGLFSDAMEPEDCGFHRDMSWVVGAIEDAYLCGLEDRG